METALETLLSLLLIGWVIIYFQQLECLYAQWIVDHRRWDWWVVPKCR